MNVVLLRRNFEIEFEQEVVEEEEEVVGDEEEADEVAGERGECELW